MLVLQNLEINQGGRTLFSNVNLNIHNKDIIGITGANGAGKSTLLRILSGKEQGFSGEYIIPADWKTSILDQDQNMDPYKTPVEIVASGREDIIKLLKRRDEILEGQGVPVEIAQLEEDLEKSGYYKLNSEIRKILSGLEIEQKFHDRPLSELSGGYRMRVYLGRLLLSNCQVALLDEPTNHLDITSIIWLEKFIRENFRGILLVVSHDRDFLNNICNRIFDIDYGTITTWRGNYADFDKSSLEYRQQKKKEAESVLKERQRQQQFVDRFKAKASKARQAQSRMKQIEKMELPEPEISSRNWPDFKFEISEKSSETVLTAENLAHSFPGNSLFANVDFSVRKMDKVVIAGPNGAGKTTLLKILAGRLNPVAGEIRTGNRVSIGYVSQTHEELNDPTMTPLDMLLQLSKTGNQTDVRSALAAVLLNSDHIRRPVSQLSGGEKTRLLLAQISILRPNCILLDEPTNHLDVESLEALEKALSDFEGTVIFVTHDLSFASRVANRIFWIGSGNFSEFKGDAQSLREMILSSKNRDSEIAETSGNRKNSYLEKKEKKSELNRNKKKFEVVENNITGLEARLIEIDKSFENPEIYNGSDLSIVISLKEEKELIQKKLEIMIEEWENLHNQIELSEN